MIKCLPMYIQRLVIYFFLVVVVAVGVGNIHDD